MTGNPKSSFGTGALLTAGMAFYWPFFRNYEFTIFFGNGLGQTVAYIELLAMLGAFCTVFLAMRSNLGRMFARHRWTVPAAALMESLGYGLLLVHAWHDSVPLVAVSLILLSLGYAMLTFAWGYAVAALPGRTSLVSMAISFSIASLLSLTSLGPVIVPLLTTMASPAISGIAWLLCTRRFTAIPECTGTQKDFVALTNLPWQLVGISILFIIVGRLVVGTLYHNGLFVSSTERLITAGLSVVIVLAVAWALVKTDKWIRLFQTGWIVLAVVYLLGTIMVIPEGSQWSQVGTALISSELSCFELILWVLLAYSTQQYRLCPIITFAMAFLVKIVSTMLGKVLVPVFCSFANISPADYLAIFVVAMAFMLVLVLIMLLNARNVSPAPPVVAAPPQQDNLAQSEGEPDATPENPLSGLESSCTQLAARHQLTSREGEVLVLLAQGYSQKRISELLVISLGTVQGHVKAIYRKFGIHSKQELIDLVRAEGGKSDKPAGERRLTQR